MAAGRERRGDSLRFHIATLYLRDQTSDISGMSKESAFDVFINAVHPQWLYGATEVWRNPDRSIETTCAGEM